MKRIVLSILVCVFLSLFVFTPNAEANIGLPMVFLGLPFLFLAFIPVVLIEMFIYRKQLGLSLKQSCWGAFLANVITTIIGYPVSWGLHTIIAMLVGFPLMYLFVEIIKYEPKWLEYAFFPITSSWLMPNASMWQIYLAGIFGLIPAFIISVRIERRLLRKMFKEKDATLVNQIVWKANKITYFLLAGVLALMVGYQGLLKAHAFDQWRDRSDEQIEFETELSGELSILSKPAIRKINPKTKAEAYIDSERYEEIADLYRYNTKKVFTEEAVWIATLDSKGEVNYYTLYRYDYETNDLKEISVVANIQEMLAIDDGLIVILDGNYEWEIKEEAKAILKFSLEGTVETLYQGDLTPGRGVAYVSPDGRKAAIVREIEIKEMGIYHEQPYWVHAELRLYNFQNKQNILIDDIVRVEEYRTVNTIPVSWHPNSDKVYYLKTQLADDYRQFMRTVDVSTLKEKYPEKGNLFEYTKVSEIMKEAAQGAEEEIYSFNLKTSAIVPFFKASSILGWDPNGNIALLEPEEESKELLLLDTRTQQTQPFRFKNLKERTEKRFAWSDDGKFIAYLGDSLHHLDQHYYRDGGYWMKDHRWLWIKELTTGKERKYDVRPINPAYDIIWKK